MSKSKLPPEMARHLKFLANWGKINLFFIILKSILLYNRIFHLQ
jgi:hypothetical protein